MHRIDGFGATAQNEFTEGNPAQAVPATVVTANWLNAVQEEIAGVIEGAGDTLDKPDNAQLLAAVQSLIDAAVAVAAAQTGDVRLTLRATAPAGWVMFNDGSIGPSGSGGTARANDDAHDLYVLLWGNITDTWAPVAGGRGATAGDDWAAAKLLTLPRMLGRALGIAGAGTDLSARGLGQFLGAETHVLVTGETPAHAHLVGARARVSQTSNTGDPWGLHTDGYPGPSDNELTNSIGGGGAHNNMQPTAFLNAMVRL